MPKLYRIFDQLALNKHSQTKTSFNQPLHLFRGLAIIAIVGAHAWSFMIFWTGSLDSIGLKVLFSITEMLFHGSTLYFALISGMLFSMVLAKRSWKQFYKKKLLHVILPYIAVSLFYFSFYGGWQSEMPQNEFFISLLLGKASIHLWYIPVLMVLYLLTPLLWQLVSNPQYKWLTLTVILIPLVISRSPFPDFIKLQTFFYFAGAYTTGLFFGCHFKRILDLINLHIKSLLLLLVVLSAAIVASYFFDFYDTGWFSVRQLLIYLQKLIITGVVLFGLYLTTDKPESAKTPKQISFLSLVTVLGDMAFSVYFLHVFFMGWIIYVAQNWLITDRNTFEIGLYGLASLVGSILASVLLTLIFQKLFSNSSRKLIGA